MTNDWIYIGLFLSADGRRRLHQWAGKYVHIPEDWRIYCDHMTVVYNDGGMEAMHQYVQYYRRTGETVALRVEEIGVSENCVAVKVSGFPSNNRIPHITVATAPNAKPVMSNQITQWKKIAPITLEATLNVYRKKR